MQVYIPPTANIGNKNGFNEVTRIKIVKSNKRERIGAVLWGIVGYGLIAGLTWWFVGVLAEIYL